MNNYFKTKSSGRKVYKEDVEKIILSSKEILTYLVDATAILFEYGDKGKIFRRPIKDYWKQRDIDKIHFSKEIYRLKQSKFIKTYFQDKEKIIELTDKGKSKIRFYFKEDLKIKIPLKWDKKWRIVIFDIPNDKKSARDILSAKLKQLGFLRIQKSVFIFPYDCKTEIDYLKNLYEIRRFVQYIIADRIDTEIDLLKHFHDNGIVK